MFAFDCFVEYGGVPPVTTTSLLRAVDSPKPRLAGLSTIVSAAAREFASGNAESGCCTAFDPAHPASKASEANAIDAGSLIASIISRYVAFVGSAV